MNKETIAHELTMLYFSKYYGKEPKEEERGRPIKNEHDLVRQYVNAKSRILAALPEDV